MRSPAAAAHGDRGPPASAKHRALLARFPVDTLVDFMGCSRTWVPGRVVGATPLANDDAILVRLHALGTMQPTDVSIRVSESTAAALLQPFASRTMEMSA